MFEDMVTSLPQDDINKMNPLFVGYDDDDDF